MRNVTVMLTVLILIILGIRFILGKRISPVLQYALWGILPLRLFVYGCEALFLSLPKSKFNVVYILEELMGSGGTATGTGMVKGEINTATGADLISNEPGNGMGKVGSSAIANSFDDAQLLMFVWVLGVMAVLLWFIVVNVRFYRKLQVNCRELPTSKVEEVLKDFPTMGRIPVYICEKISTPCLAGVRRKAVYIPPVVEENSTILRYALIHELCHRKHLDLFWSAVRSLMLALFWYNPLMWVAAFLSRWDCEMACDATVIRQIGQTECIAYGKALVGLVDTGGKQEDFMCTATTMTGSGKIMHERMMRIVTNRKMTVAGFIAALFIIFVAGACTFTDAEESWDAPLPYAEQQELLQFGESWAKAYCGRDGNALLNLCADEKVFTDIGGQIYRGIMENGQAHVTIGMSSPWPWYAEECNFEVTAGKVRVYLWSHAGEDVSLGIMELNCAKGIDGEYELTGATLKDYAKIDSKAKFTEAYKYGFSVYSRYPMAEGHQQLADENTISFSSHESLHDIYCDPVKAARDEMHLEGVTAKLKSGSDLATGQVAVTLQWEDGTAEVKMVQPGVRGENGIWIPAD